MRTATAGCTRWASIKAYSREEEDEACRMLVELLEHLAEWAKPSLVPPLDRVRAWCPPEARYSFQGRRD